MCADRLVELTDEGGVDHIDDCGGTICRTGRGLGRDVGRRVLGPALLTGQLRLDGVLHLEGGLAVGEEVAVVRLERRRVCADRLVELTDEGGVSKAHHLSDARLVTRGVTYLHVCLGILGQTLVPVPALYSGIATNGVAVGEDDLERDPGAVGAGERVCLGEGGRAGGTGHVLLLGPA